MLGVLCSYLLQACRVHIIVLTSTLRESSLQNRETQTIPIPVSFHNLTGISLLCYARRGNTRLAMSPQPPTPVSSLMLHGYAGQALALPQIIYIIIYWYDQVSLPPSPRKNPRWNPACYYGWDLVITRERLAAVYIFPEGQAPTKLQCHVHELHTLVGTDLAYWSSLGRSYFKVKLWYDI